MALPQVNLPTIALPSGAGLVVQIAGSLLAILFVWWLAQRMGLGGDVRIRDEDHARDLARQTLCDFAAVALSVDRARVGALLRDTRGRVMVLRRHGSHFVGRLLTTHSSVRLDRGNLVIATGDRRFGSVTLDLGNEAQVWAASLRRLDEAAR